MSDVRPAAGASLSGGAGANGVNEVQADRGRRKEDDRADRDRQKDDEKRLKAVSTSDKELLSWTRMSMSLVATGLGAEQALTYLRAGETGRRLDPFDVLRTLAICLMVLGISALILACVQTLRVRRSARRGEPIPTPRFPLSLIVALGVIAIFGVALVTVVSFRDVVKSAGTAAPAATTFYGVDSGLRLGV